MDFLFAMSIFTSGADISRDKVKAQEWMRSWAATDDDKGAAAAEGRPQRRRGEPRAQKVVGPQGGKRRLQGRRPWIAPEFDGLNCFETVVSH